MLNDSRKIFILSFCGLSAIEILYYFWHFIASIVISASYSYYYYHANTIYVLDAISCFFSCLAFAALLVFVGAAAFEDFAGLKTKIQKLWFIYVIVLTN